MRFDLSLRFNGLKGQMMGGLKDTNACAAPRELLPFRSIDWNMDSPIKQQVRVRTTRFERRKSLSQLSYLAYA